jgi:hypothetical protein
MGRLFRILKNNIGLIAIIAAGLFVLVSTVINNIAEDIAPVDTTPPVTAPSIPIPTSESTPEPTESQDEGLSDANIRQAPNLDVLIEDAAVDAAMAVVGIAYGVSYELSPLDMLAIMRPSIGDYLYAKFDRMYALMDWDKINAEKTVIYTDIVESGLLPGSSGIRVQAEILLKFVDGEQNPVKSRKNTLYLVDLERNFDFNIWTVIDVNIK